MQLIVHKLGGEVKTSGGGEYGRMPVHVVKDSTLYGQEMEDKQQVWMCHGDAPMTPL
jgi:GMP synthase (glutamine-hydrolysing)